MLNNFSSDTRGQSVVIGFVLILGILVVALSIYQSTVVPQQNQSVEFQHYTGLQDDMTTYDTTISQTKTLNSASTTISLSQAYPNRLITVNPPAFSTQLSISEPSDATVSNFSIQSSGNEEVYWSQQDQISIPTSSITARPDYHVWQESNPINYENQISYVESGQNPMLLTSQPVIQDEKIEIHGYNGRLSSTTSSTQQITVNQISSSRESLYISGDTSGSPIQIQVPTQLPEMTWNEILETTNNDNIESTSYDEETELLTIHLDPSQTYRFEGYLSGSNAPYSIIELSEPAYIQNQTGDTVQSGQQIRVSVHDQLGNSTGGKSVVVETDPQNCITETEKRTSADGQATFTCETPQNTSVIFQINDGSESYESVQVNVTGSDSTQPPGQQPSENITATITSITSQQVGGGPPQDRPYEIDVEWEITTQENSISDATLRLQDDEGNLVDQRQLTVSGQSENGQETFDVTGRDNTFEAILTATDQNGQTDEDTATITTE